MFRVPKYRMSNMQEIPINGFGTRNLEEKECFDAVRFALTMGYRHFDTSPTYENEHIVGDAIALEIQDNKVKREELYITSKLSSKSHSPNFVRKALQRSLERLRLDYVDLYLMEFPIGFECKRNQSNQLQCVDIDYLQTWAAMEELVDDGIVHSIGVSNFKKAQILRLLANCRIKPVVNQIEYHIGFKQKQLVDVCRKNRIDVVAHSPLAGGGKITSAPNIFRDPKVESIAIKYKKSPAQICLRYLLQTGVLTISKSRHKQYIYENYNIFDFTLTDADMLKLNKVKGPKKIEFVVISHHKGYPCVELKTRS